MELEYILRNHFFKLVDVKTKYGALYTGYLVGIKLPVNDLLMLYIVKPRHADKYARLGNPNWLEQIPHETITGITHHQEQDGAMGFALGMRAASAYTK